MSAELEVRDAIVGACQRLYRRNMLAACDGNLSVLMDDNYIVMTPSAKAKAFIAAADMATLDINDRVISGRPSSERWMHLTIYKNCPKAKAVVHAHPPYAMAWTLVAPSITELPFNSLPEVILAVGNVPVVPYARPGTTDMGKNLLPFLPQHRALILARHGAVTWGESLDEAVHAMERIEHTAMILYLARQLGELNPLPESEISALLEMRKKIGEVSL